MSKEILKLFLSSSCFLILGLLSHEPRVVFRLAKFMDYWPEIPMFIYKLINYLWSFLVYHWLFTGRHYYSILRQCILQTILYTTVNIWVKIAIPESSSSGKTDVTFLALR